MSPIVHRLEREEAQRRLERAESQRLLRHADMTRRALHREVVELLSLLDGESMQAEVASIELGVPVREPNGGSFVTVQRRTMKQPARPTKERV